MGRDLIAELVSVALRKIETQGEFPTDPGVMEDLVDEVIDEFARDGLITDDANTEVLRAEMINRLKNELSKP